MGLRNLTFKTVEVQTSGGPLAVRGLGLDHLLTLFYRHGTDLTSVFDDVVAKVRAEEKIDEFDVTRVSVQLITKAPQIVAEVIALAAGSDAADHENFAGDVGIAKQLVAAEQIDALEKIAVQTFTSDMTPGKMFALVRKAMQAGTSAMADLPTN